MRRSSSLSGVGPHVQREIDLIVPGWLSSDDDKWFPIDINKSIARHVSFGHSLYINETTSVAIRPCVRAKALPGETTIRSIIR